MIYSNSFLNNLNPVTKLILMTIPTILVTFAYDIYVPSIFFIIIFISSVIFGKINFFVLLNKMIKFIIIGLSFSLFIVTTRLFTHEGLTQEIIITSISLCLRIMVFSLTSVVFVITTDPNEFALSLIHQLKISYKFVYPFLTAYRFMPTFQEELQKIILAKEIRGISSNKGLISSIVSFPKYILPLLTSAVRKGERVSMSMECRAFGAYEDRTYYNVTSIKKGDYIAIAAFISMSAVIVIIGIRYNFIMFKLGLIIN